MDWTPTAKHHVNLCFGKDRDENREEYMKNYRKQYRAKRSRYVDCGCGARFQELCVYSHKFSKRHTDWVASQNVDNEILNENS